MCNRVDQYQRQPHKIYTNLYREENPLIFYRGGNPLLITLKFINESIIER